MRRSALIVGVAGQDGSLLAELLLEKGYAVHGVVRGCGPHANLAAIEQEVELVEAELCDHRSVARLLDGCKHDEVYNLASVSFSPASWDKPVDTAQLGTVAVTVLLEAIRLVGGGVRFYQASSSEIFGRPVETPQNEQTPSNPITPYGVAKTYAHLLTRVYRARYGLFACSGILYNHESERRPLHFLSRKVARAAAAISLGLESELRLGDLHPRRDWGAARDYVRAMWLMLQHDEPADFVVASGTTHSVGEFVECAFDRVGLDWRDHVRIDPAFQRGSAELHDLVGDASKARSQLGWEPTVSFEELVHLLVDAELERFRVAASERR